MTGVDFLRARAAVAPERHRDVSQVLDVVGMPLETARSPIGTMSGGQFQ
jgi:ABC-type Mn2+/Zn2+ transport system ATPase subunit